MKRNKYPGCAGLFLMAGALCMFAPGLHAQNEQAPPPQQQQPQQEQPPEQQQQATPQSQTFAGTIMKLQDGKYALVTGKSAQGQLSGHFLDDQDNAKKYDGKKVQVTGTLDMASNTIHVSKIAAA
jgi:hypothetical protein